MPDMEAEAANYWQAARALRAAARRHDVEEFAFREGEIAGIAANTDWPKLRELCLMPAVAARRAIASA